LGSVPLAPVILLPGAVLPAVLAYGGLLSVLGPDVDAIAKDLELYATASPPVDYTLDVEVGGVLRAADARGWDRFHLVGYSGGGAVALAVAARYPQRLLSLALLEAAWAGDWDWSRQHRELWAAQRRILALPTDEFMVAFMRLTVAPGVDLPPPLPGDPPAWMALRPAGISALVRAFDTYALGREALASFSGPVYFALGGLSNPDQYGHIAARLGQVFGDYQVEVFDDRHHFDPPHRTEPERLARSLRAVWARAERPEP
jgi:pimeloyl-ACP methyl ester carboxylesterase